MSKKKNAYNRALASLDKDTETVIRNGTFALFLDETGHEEFKSDGRLFGFAGVAGYGAEIVRAQRKWRAMKAAYFEGASAQLHASGTKMTREQLAAISTFFSECHIGRFAYIIEEPPIQLPWNAIDLLRGFLCERLLDALGALTTTPKEIVLCFEYSDRLLPKLLDALPGLAVTVDGAEIGCILLVTPKSSGNELLEMADQVGHRAQRQFRETGGHVYGEFEAVFPSSPVKYAQYGSLRLSSIRARNAELIFETPTTARVQVRFSSASDQTN